MYALYIDCDGNSGFVERLVRISIECELETLTNPFVSVSLRLQRRETLSRVGGSLILFQQLKPLVSKAIHHLTPHRSVVNEKHNLKRAPNFPHLCCVVSPQEAFRCKPKTSNATETAVLLKD